MFSDDFYQQNKNCKGVACVFSLKNPSYPEFICLSHCAISSVDVHPSHPHMLVTGLVDGNVAVYDLQKRNCRFPSYMSTSKNGKHRDIAWQVCYIILFSSSM